MEAHLNIDLTHLDDDLVLNVLGAKLHGIYITEANLNYHGSITIDSYLLEMAQILPMEYVNIWNKNTGARLSTYVLPGERHSGICCLNGGAARHAQVGDEIIIATERKISIATLKKLQKYQAPVLMFNTNNQITEYLTYCLQISHNSLIFNLAENKNSQARQ